MVKFLIKLKSNPAFMLGCIIIIVFSALIFKRCIKNETSIITDYSNINSSMTSNTIKYDIPQVISYQEHDAIALPSPMVFRKSKQLSKDVLIAVDEFEKKIIKYDIRNGEVSDLIGVTNKDNFIKTFVCNSEWIVWVEDESLIYNTSNKSYKWEMIAQNVSTGEQVVIDKSKFKTNKYEVPMFVEYVPDKIDISMTNVVVYRRTSPNMKKITSEVMLYDLDAQRLELITQTNNVNKEMIGNCCIYNSKVAWSVFSQLQENYDKRLTQYLYSDIYVYDISTKRINQLTEKSFYDEPSIYEDKLAVIYIPEKREEQHACYSEVVIIDINSNEVKTIVDENSPCYKKREYELYRTLPKINSKFVSWYNNMFSNRFIYDYTRDAFIELNNDLGYVGRIDTIIWRMFDNAVLMGVFDNNHQQELFYVYINQH